MSQDSLWTKLIGRVLKGPQSIEFTAAEPSPSLPVTRNHLDVSLGGSNCGFDADAYFRQLGTQCRLGRQVLFVPAIGSTMDTAQTLVNAGAEFDDVVVVARQQLSGKGRGGNVWASPVGCAMFSLPLRLSLSSGLGRRSGFAQHLLATAAAEAVAALAPTFPIRIKWPNDLYFRRERKVGGILVSASVQGDELRAVLGCGLNVANSEPSLCLNDRLPEDAQLPVEEVIGEIVKRLDLLLQQFDKEGAESMLPVYHKYWLHGNEEITIEASGEVVVIESLDQHGFLQVRSKSSGAMFSLHPDGNSFDMMKGLIKAKTT